MESVLAHITLDITLNSFMIQVPLRVCRRDGVRVIWDIRAHELDQHGWCVLMTSFGASLPHYLQSRLGSFQSSQRFRGMH
jgi:hypothetical protein